MLEDLNSPYPRDAKAVGYVLVGLPGEEQMSIHTTRVNRGLTLSRKMKGQVLPVVTHHSFMEDRWPQRMAYKARLTAWRKAQGITLVEAAKQLGTTYNTLRQYISPARRDTRPGLEFLQRSVALFGGDCRITEFVDDPGSVAGGIPLGDLKPIVRSQFERMIQVAGGGDYILTQEDLDKLYEDYIKDAAHMDQANRKRK